MVIQVISILLLIIIPLLVLSGNFSTIFLIALGSLIFDQGLTFLGFPFSIFSFIFLNYLIFYPNQVLKICRNFGAFLWLDFFLVSLVGLFFLVFLPWQDPYFLERAPTQRLPLRTIIGIFRTLELIFGTYFFYFIITQYKISTDFILKGVVVFLVISLVIGYIDYKNILPFSFRQVLIPNHYALERFTGLTGEPRAIAQICATFILFFIPFLKIKSGRIKNILIFGITISLIMIALSLSSSGAGYLLICLVFYVFIGKIKIKYIIISLAILAVFSIILLNNPEYVSHQTAKLARVTLEAQDTRLMGVPQFFNAFEVFDQSALAFFYFNPENLIFGVGPNTINIPSSVYMSDLAIRVLGTNINTSPINGLVYILSRTGIIGLIIYVLSIGNYIIHFKNKFNYLYEILFLGFIYFFLYREDSFFFIFAMVVAFYKNKDL